MKEKVKIIAHGQSWTVIDMELGFRICNSYQDYKDKDAPSHLHNRFDEAIASCSADTAKQAYDAMKVYRINHTGLDVDALEAEVKKWK